jgi:hypothetical protein
VDVLTSGAPVLISDLDDGDAVRRWPGLTPQACQAGAAAVFALPLQMGRSRWGRLAANSWARVSALTPAESQKVVAVMSTVITSGEPTPAASRYYRQQPASISWLGSSPSAVIGQQERIWSTAASATSAKFCHTDKVPPGHPSRRLSEGRARRGRSRLQVHVQADGGASGTGADLDQIADLLDDPQPAPAPGRDWIPF